MARGGSIIDVLSNISDIIKLEQMGNTILTSEVLSLMEDLALEVLLLRQRLDRLEVEK